MLRSNAMFLLLVKVMSFLKDFYTNLPHQCIYSHSCFEQTCHSRTQQSIFQIILRNGGVLDFHQNQLLLSYVDSNVRTQTLELTSQPTQNM
jgi:hypothetical protein